jgi:hypothetical protein
MSFSPQIVYSSHDDDWMAATPGSFEGGLSSVFGDRPDRIGLLRAFDRWRLRRTARRELTRERSRMVSRCAGDGRRVLR